MNTKGRGYLAILDEPALVCCVCLYTSGEVASKAITIIGGYAVCEDHMGLLAQGEEWGVIMRAAKL